MGYSNAIAFQKSMEKQGDKKEKKEGKEGKEKKEKKKEKDDKDDRAGKENVGKSMEHLDMRKLFKEGQKSITPPLADSTRAFYGSLYKENPDSKIAIKYCIE